MPTTEIPSFADVLKARKTIAPYLARTPLLSYPQLDALLDAEVYVKREDCNPTSAFKVRGGINLMANLTPEERARGVIGSSTGNHGQSMVYAARLFGVGCTIGLPENANPVKVAAMRSLGAALEFHGSVFDEAKLHVEKLAAEHGYRYVHSANEPLLIAGVGTYTLEVMEEVPDLDYLFVPLGGGSGAAGACIVCKTVRRETRVIAVQSAQAPAGYDSWKAGHLVERPMRSIAEGLATGSAYELPQEILRRQLDDFVLVDDADLKAAIVHYAERCHLLAEHAGAAALAGALKLGSEIRGKKVGLVLSGANVTLDQLRDAMTSAGPE
jgi:threonine dehydratase